MIPKLIFIGLTTLGLGMNIANHGKERGKENAWTSIISYLITIGLLYWAGLFDEF